MGFGSNNLCLLQALWQCRQAVAQLMRQQLEEAVMKTAALAAMQPFAHHSLGIRESACEP